MPDAIWVDRSDELPALASMLEAHSQIGLDTEFLRERTFFPKLCLLQLAAAGRIWCVDTLHGGTLAPLVAPLVATRPRKVIHAARQDLEAFYLASKQIIAPVFDTQIAAGCVGLKPQIGYADLVTTLLGITLNKGQTRTDWSRRPLTAAQLQYAAEDVLYLEQIADLLTVRLRALGREHWAAEDCAALSDPLLYEPDEDQAWERLRGLAQLEPAARARARSLAVWREKRARERDLPRAWILPDPAIFAVALANPGSRAALAALDAMPTNFNDGFAAGLLEMLERESAQPLLDENPSRDARPTPEQRAVIDRLAKVVDARAAELGVSAELLAPRGELKVLAMGGRHTHALRGWRLCEIGERLLSAVH